MLSKKAIEEIKQRYWINEDQLYIFIQILKDHDLYEQFEEYYKIIK